MRRTICILLFLSWLLLTVCYGKSRYKNNPDSDKLVVLIHGIADKPMHLWKIEKETLDAGYSVLNFDYKSTKTSMDSVIISLKQEIDSVKSKYNEIHFVVHSLGSFVLRAYLYKYPLENCINSVLIAPPSKGSIMAERFEKFKPFQWLYGEAGQKLGKGDDDYWQVFPPPEKPFGIIAGGINTKHGINPLIPGDDDGTVGVQETKIEGYSDFIIIPGLHSSLLWQSEVIDQILYFLRNEQFNHEKT